MKYPTQLKVDQPCDLIEELTRIHANMRNEIRMSANNQKVKYDTKNGIQEVRLKLGDRVYWTKVTPKKSKKLNQIRSGPYLIIAEESPVNFWIEGSNGNSIKVHVNQLSLCHNDSLELASLRKRGRPRKI